MQNYFNYYTEIEEHFQRRRGTLLMLSTLDWALIAAWQEAGFPLEAVIAGIDASFDKYAARQAKGRVRRINGLAYCAQGVLRAMEDMHEAAIGAVRKQPSSPEESGFEASRIAGYLRDTARQLHAAAVPSGAQLIISEAAEKLIELATSMESSSDARTTEALERHLVVLEDQICGALQSSTPAEELVGLREQSAQELAPYRGRMQTVQIRQIEQQFLRRCLFQQNRIPRLSLFYMRQT